MPTTLCYAAAHLIHLDTARHYIRFHDYQFLNKQKKKATQNGKVHQSAQQNELYCYLKYLTSFHKTVTVDQCHPQLSPLPLSPVLILRVSSVSQLQKARHELIDAGIRRDTGELHQAIIQLRLRSFERPWNEDE